MIAFSFINESALAGKRHPKPIGYEDINIVVGQVTNLSKSITQQSVAVLVKFEGGPFRQRHDGGLPVSDASILSASGYLRGDSDEIFLSRDESIMFSVVLDTLGPLPAVNGILRVTYYG
jgi:hypothetical protein